MVQIIHIKEVFAYILSSSASPAKSKGSMYVIELLKQSIVWILDMGQKRLSGKYVTRLPLKLLQIMRCLFVWQKNTKKLQIALLYLSTINLYIPRQALTDK